MNAVLQYQNDWDERLRQQAALLREGRFNEVDRDAIADELEAIVQKEESALRSYIKQLMIHLCKLRYVANRDPTQHWEGEIANFRDEIDDLCVNAFTNPARQESTRQRAWRGARKVLAATLTAAELRALPRECPFTWEQLRDDDYLG